MDTLPRTPRPAAEWLSAHGRTRCRQRGTNHRLLEVVRDWADLEVPVGGGARALSVSDAAAAEMRAEGCPSDLVERAKRRTLVQHAGLVVTVIAGRERRGRHYRRRIWRRPHRSGRR